MKILIAPDSFKNCMTAIEACDAIENGIRRADKNAVIYKIPLADGGEGTARIITHARRAFYQGKKVSLRKPVKKESASPGRLIKVRVTGPLGKKVNAEFGLINFGTVAVLDIASASGLELISERERNPMKATSYGSGELIKAALDTGAKELVIGIGGSATNDGGIGMLAALGFRFLDKKGNAVWRGAETIPLAEQMNGEALLDIDSIDFSGADKRLSKVKIKVACDVTNPLLGKNGASAVFGTQKGADPKMVKLLDKGLSKLADALIKAGLAGDVNQPGDGAAGGIGAAMRICLGAKMESGAMLVMKYSGFFDRLHDCDLVITGEGKTDSQTASGKLCSVVAREARKKRVPVALLSGALDGDLQNLLSVFDYAVSISCGEPNLELMIKNAKRNLSFAAENLIRGVNI